MLVTAGMMNFDPWCPEVGLTCVGWDDAATRADLATRVLESGHADRRAKLLAADVAGVDDPP